VYNEFTTEEEIQRNEISHRQIQKRGRHSQHVPPFFCIPNCIPLIKWQIMEQSGGTRKPKPLPLDAFHGVQICQIALRWGSALVTFRAA